MDDLKKWGQGRESDTDAGARAQGQVSLCPSGRGDL